MKSRYSFLFICVLTLFSPSISWSEDTLPLVINTWAFSNATIQAWDALSKDKSAVDAIVEGCSVCEKEQCDYTVGYGGSPDENGETTLDAMIMCGKTMNIGAVAALRNVKDAIAVAKHVLLYTKHTLLAGEQASEFAYSMGFKKESLGTIKSKKMYMDWKKRNCQPNFWTNVMPSPNMNCGGYRPIEGGFTRDFNDISSVFSESNHDTIGMIVIDKTGNIGAGTSTNGASHKIPGRVGDSPIPGAGAYADNTVGAAAATGDGDIMMRFLPSFLAVEYLRQNLSPHEAGERALMRIANYYPNFVGGIIVTDKNGNYGAACHGLDVFPYSVYSPESKNVIIKKVKCLRSI
ncbi:unnamed protein product [Diamesa serratosioi]